MPDRRVPGGSAIQRYLDAGNLSTTESLAVPDDRRRKIPDERFPQLGEVMTAVGARCIRRLRCRDQIH